MSLGLRASEVLALKWKHVDWLNRKLSVEQRIYRQHVDDTKTRSSSAELDLDSSLLRVLKEWRQGSQFRGEEDWMWASPTQLGRLPISYPWYWRCFNDAAIKAGIGPLGTHAPAHLPFLDGFRRNANCGPTETHAPFRHQDDDECLRRCR